jgi:hypothetical protein
MAVLALVLGAIGVAQAAAPFAGNASSQDVSLYPKSIIVTGNGVFNVGGVCSMDIKYAATAKNLKNNIDSEVPVKESQQVPWTFTPQEPFFPGCHIVHFKDGKEIRQADSNDGTWRVCFGARPDVDTKIYFYEDKPADGVRVWQPLPSSKEDTFVCADALYSGVYIPAGEPPQGAGIPVTGGNAIVAPPPVGSIAPPPTNTRIRQSGAYSVGGICTLEVIYKKPNLSDDVFVEIPTKDTKVVPFPDDKAFLYLPGCHVLHYEPLMMHTTDDMGSWKICFAEVPGKKTTIYYYLDDKSTITPPWVALPTTVEDGQACAPANWTGVYAPAAG